MPWRLLKCLAVRTSDQTARSRSKDALSFAVRRCSGGHAGPSAGYTQVRASSLRRYRSPPEKVSEVRSPRLFEAVGLSPPTRSNLFRRAISDPIAPTEPVASRRRPAVESPSSKKAGAVGANRRACRSSYGPLVSPTSSHEGEMFRYRRLPFFAAHGRRIPLPL